MEVDIKTIVLIIGIFRLMMMLVFFYQYKAARNISGPGWWLLYSLADIVSSLVILSRNLPGFLPFAKAIQDPVIVAGSLLIYIGVKRFFEKKVSFRILASYFIIYYLLHLFFYIIIDDANIRTLLMYLFLTVITFLTALFIFRNKYSLISLTANLLIGILTFHGIVYLIRVFVIIFGVSSPSMFMPDPVNYLVYFDALIIGLLLAFGLIIMVNQRLNAEIMTMNEKLRKSNAEKDKLFSVIAHDLINPFNVFLGMSQIMAEDEPGITVSVMKERASIIHNDASRLHKLLSNLLDWSKLERGLIRFNPEKLPLSGLVADSIESIEEQARIKGVELIVRIPSDIIVIADRNAFNSIIRNLVSNAVKFTRKGGEVVISARYLEDKKIEISVKDNGIGMPPEMLESIFRIDARTNRNGTDGEPSTGLGLILCKDFIEISSGRIWATSNEAEGSAFFFTLPSGL